MTDRSEFAGYLESIATTYAQWWDRYTLMDAIQLTVQTVQPRQTEERSPTLGERSTEKIEKFLVLEGILKYAVDHVLLSGKPGSGKSTALKRLLLDQADRAGREETDKIPVLVELRSGKAIAKLIQETLRRHRLKLTDEQIDDLLFDSKLLLLMDGINEITSVELLQDLEDFRANNPDTPMIFTTRDLGLGGDLGIAKKLEMQPLNELQMQEFVSKYLPSQQGSELLRQLQHRLRELGETPLLLKMLCDVFGYAQQIPQNKGELFRGFDRDYDQFKRIDTISADLRRWKSELLQHLAFRMMQGKEATQPMLQIARSEAEKILEELLRDRVSAPGDKAKIWLEDLLEHHLLQVAGDRTQIEFHHQLFQEYYAAEYLLHQLPELLKDEQRFQKEYLNYLKWTEAIALMLALVEDEGLAVRVVKLAIGVDLMLGARLAGSVRFEFQNKTVNLITDLNVCPLLKVKFLEKTCSELAILGLLKALENNDSDVRKNAAAALSKYKREQAILGLFKALEYTDSDVRMSPAAALNKYNSEQALSALLKAKFKARALKYTDSDVRMSPAAALSKHNSEQAIPVLFKALEDPDSLVRMSAAAALGRLSSEQAVPALLKALEDLESFVRMSAAAALGKLSSEQAVPALLKALEDPHLFVRKSATVALGKIGRPNSLANLWKTQLSATSIEAYSAIANIQSRCKFYNYEIFQAAEAIVPISNSDYPQEVLARIDQRTKQMSEEPKRIIHTQNYFEKGNHEHTHNYSSRDEVLKQKITELRQMVTQLQQIHQPVNEAEATKIIDVEFHAIQKTNPTRWKIIQHQLQLLKRQILNPESHLKATKAAIAEIAKHYLEESVVSKALITYIDTLSAEAEEGE